MRFFTLLAGYAAGLAVAMKYRKDDGTSKLDTDGPTKTKFNSIIDEVIDIHKSAFSDLKGLVRENFDDVENFDDLQKKVTTIVTDFADNLDARIEAAKEAGMTKKDELLSIASDFYTTHEATLVAAKDRAISFTDASEEKIEAWIAGARKDITDAYHIIQEKFSELSDTSPEEDEEAKKSPPTKTHSKKDE